MTERDIFSVLEDGKPFKSAPRVLRKDRVKKEVGNKPIVKKKKQVKIEETVVNPETNFVAD